MSSNEENLRRLTETVTTLATAVAAIEARREKTIRLLRMFGIGAICATVLGIYLGTGAIERAEAANKEIEPIAQQLAQLNQVIGQMAQGMGPLFQSPGLSKLVNNGGVLAERLKQDSDALRLLMLCKKRRLQVDECFDRIQSGELQPPPGVELVDVSEGEAPEALAMMRNIESIEQISQVLGNELQKLNRLLEAIPQMRAEMGFMRHDMNVMSGQMGVMAGSMGSTMGRAATWMPW